MAIAGLWASRAAGAVDYRPAMRGASVSVTVADVDRIVAVDDPVLRNLQLTVAYGRMAADFAELVDRDNLSWCGFGTWASEGVGASIRHHQTDQSIVLRATGDPAPGLSRDRPHGGGRLR